MIIITIITLFSYDGWLLLLLLLSFLLILLFVVMILVVTLIIIYYSLYYLFFFFLLPAFRPGEQMFWDSYVHNSVSTFSRACSKFNEYHQLLRLRNFLASELINILTQPLLVIYFCFYVCSEVNEFYASVLFLLLAQQFSKLQTEFHNNSDNNYFFLF